jgi:hypothetical protein
VATAFGHTFVWGFAMALVAILPAIALLRAERAARRPDAAGVAQAGNANVALARADAA